MTSSETPCKLAVLRWIGRQTWIPRGRGWILRLFCDPKKCDPYPFEADFFGSIYHGVLSDHIDWNVFMYGSYAYPELSLLEELAAEIKSRRESVTFFDVGANKGHHTLFMARLVDKVIAFEPFEPARHALEHKIAANYLDNVQIFPIALGSVDNKLRYFPGGDRNSGSGTLIATETGKSRESLTVTVRNGDSLLEECRLPRLDLLKIDVEGFEPFVLRGLLNRVCSDRPAILTELSDLSRAGIGTESEFYKLFYEGAILAEVAGRSGCRFKLRKFRYSVSSEVLIVPPEWADFVFHRLDD